MIRRAWSFARLSPDVVVILLLFLLSFVMWLPRLTGPLDLRWDAGAYYTLGRSLAEGHGYRLLNEPGRIEAIQYPPLWPAVIAAHQLILNSNDYTYIASYLRFDFCLIFILNIIIIYLVLRRHLGVAYALLGALISLVNPTAIFISDFCQADLPFAFLTALFVLLHHDHNGRPSRVMVPFIAMATYALRTSGLALLAAWVTESILNRRLKQAVARMVLTSIPILGWQLYVHSVEQSFAYVNPTYQYQRDNSMYYNVSYTRNISLVDPFVPQKGRLTPMALTAHLVGNLWRMPQTLGEAVCAGLDIWIIPFRVLGEGSLFVRTLSRLVKLTAVCMGGLALWGIILQLRRRQYLIPIFIMFSVFLICITPFNDMFSRYIIPLIPFLALSLLEAVMWLSQKARPRFTGWASADIIPMVLVVALCLIPPSVFVYKMFKSHRNQIISYKDQQGRRIEYRLFYYDEACRALEAGIDWLGSHAKPSDVLAVSVPHWVFLRTGRTTVMPPFEPDPLRVEALLNSVPVDFVVVDSSLHGKPADPSQYVAPMVCLAQDRWKCVFRSPRGGCEIYRRVDP